MVLQGRQRIYTDEIEITQSNIMDVLNDAFSVHNTNHNEIQFLLNYDKGVQPLARQKVIRPNINIEIVDNVADYIKQFHVDYFWSNAIMLVQRGNNEHHNTDAVADDNGINALNEMLTNGENINLKDLEAGDFAEICGLGYKFVDIRTYFDGLSYIHDYSVNPLYAFCVYRNDITQRKMLGVTYNITSDGEKKITAFTDEYRFEITDDILDDVQPNPLGMIPLVEVQRSVDRTGCFERLISDLDALNILQSDFANDVAQTVQSIWWGNDIDFPEDANGNPVKPKDGQWLLTYSNDGAKDPKVQNLASSLNGANVLKSINDKRNWILQKAKVPMQYDSAGGGSTGVATDMASGWSNAEIEALMKEQLVKAAKREEMALILRALEAVPESILPMDDPIRKVHVTDIDFHFNRRRNYDMSIKANTFSTYIKAGINGRHALKEIDAFPDPEQVWIDSKDTIESIQRSLVTDESTDTSADDVAEQTDNSPIIDKIG